MEIKPARSVEARCVEMDGVKGVEMNKAQTLQYVGDSVRYIQSLGTFE